MRLQILSYCFLTSGGWYNPPDRKKIRKKNSKCNQYDLLLVLSKSSLTTFKTIFETLSVLEACQMTIIGGVVYKKSINFEVFENISATFWYFFVKYFLIAKYYLFVVINIKIWIMDALFTLETRLKVPILAVFEDCSSFLFWHKPLA